MSLTFDCTDPRSRERALRRAADALSQGELVVVPTGSGYGLACDAFQPAAVDELAFTRGMAEGQAPPVLIGHPRTADGLATSVTPAARQLMSAFWPGDLTLVLKAQPTLEWELGGPRGVVSLRVPLHPVLLELLDRTGPLAVTAGNVVGHPHPRTCQEAKAQLANAVSVYLNAGEPVRTGTSTVVDARRDTVRVLREGVVTAERLRSVIGDLLEAPAAKE